MDLILWRHAQAEDHRDDLDDLARKLTGKGEKQARHMANWIKPRLPSNIRVISSPAVRTCQTADALNLAYTVTDAIAPNASATELRKILTTFHAEDALLMVGHQPTLGQLAASLLAGKPLDWSIRKGAIWWLQDVNGPTPRLRLVLDPCDVGIQ